MKINCILFILFALQQNALASNILFLVPFPGPSHYVFIGNFVKELIARGHDVTAITNFKLNENSTRYNEILIDPQYDKSGHVVRPGNQNAYVYEFQYLTVLYELGIRSGIHGLRDKNVQKLINRNDIHFDLIISEQFFQESWLMFSRKYRAPIVTIGTYGYSDFFDSIMGLRTSWSFVPHMITNYSDRMTFFQRVHNTILSLADAFYRKYYYLPAQNDIVQEIFGSIESLQPIPSVEELEKSISIMLINSHISIVPPRPSMPGLIDIGGAGIRAPKKLPADIQKFLDEAVEGVVYVSFGANVKWRDMPTEKLNEFVESFNSLKFKVLWKCDLTDVPNQSTNIFIRQWLPQSDILAHKNVRLFITHGGMFGTTEGISRGVPMLFMPFYGDQFRNAAKTVEKGFGLILHIRDVSRQKLTEKIETLVYDKQYRERVKEISKIFNDNLVHPMDEAMYWIEYVIRHKGAAHLKSAAVEMPFYAYYSIDVFGVLIALPIVVLAVLVKLCSGLCCRSKNGRIKESKKKRN
ncbi:hypothetical protein HA402_013599 [Bradysia odoriphaga]|nr:hypothetical protein HA402_013599 [Bradysia odoriphaga]